ncbi:MAG: membrane protein [Rhodobacter sp. CACIA14H1]|nr:MAG: membrane protein [Rhodobacter sp. CACIA14H1]
MSEGFLKDRDVYLGVLGLDGEDKREARKDALARAHGLRTVEIELYWKRATYFWGFQIAAFAGFGVAIGAMAKEGAVAPGMEVPLTAFVLAIAVFGLGSAWFSLLGAKASKQWQLNWERHVDMLQEEFEGKLYRMIFRMDDGSAPMLSVTAVNVGLSKLLLGCWVVLGVSVLWFLAGPFMEGPEAKDRMVLGAMGLILCLCGYNLFLRGGLRSGFAAKQRARFGRHALVERIE